jgi:hypothetical protein
MLLLSYLRTGFSRLNAMILTILTSARQQMRLFRLELSPRKRKSKEDSRSARVIRILLLGLPSYWFFAA